MIILCNKCKSENITQKEDEHIGTKRNGNFGNFGNTTHKEEEAQKKEKSKKILISLTDYT